MKKIEIKKIYQKELLNFSPIQMNLRTNFNIKNITFNVSNKKLKVIQKSKDILILSNDLSKKYIVLNGTSRNFKEIKLTEGIEVNDFSKVEIGISVNKFSTNFKLILSEYDTNLKKTRLNKCNLNKLNLINLQKTTKFILIIIEVSGKCKIKINGLIFNKKIDTKETLITSNTILNTSNKNLEEFSQQAYQAKKSLENYKKSNAYKTNQRLIKESKLINNSNGIYYYNKLSYNIAIISDVYMYNFYKDTFRNVYYLSPENYQEVMNKKVDFVFYITSWKGINNQEWQGIKYREKPKNALDNIIKISQEKQIKLVFQTIEDPSNYEYFLPIAKKFDYIFTSDVDMIDKYKNDLNHNNVFYGEYGFNPLVNNPIDSFKYILEDTFFAGSYTTRYKERCQDNNIIMNSVLQCNNDLIIADRNYNSGNKELEYPSKYMFNLIPAFSDHITLQKIHKLFKYNINLNSIKQSPTMCAMRVYELQAQGSLIISNYAKSVYNKFPNIQILSSEEHFDNYTKDQILINKYKNENIRMVMTNKTSFDILNSFMHKITHENKLTKKNKIIVLYRNKLDKNIQICFNNQSYEDKILLSEEEYFKYLDKYHSLYEYITWFNADNEYEKYYLEDLVNSFKYTDCSYVTKNSYFTQEKYLKDIEHEYTKYFNSIDRTLFRIDRLDTKIYNLNYNASFSLNNGYSADPYNCNYLRYMENNKVKVSNYLLTVIVPVYNNGLYLKYKCLTSLQRNVVFEKIEVLLVNDNSTEQDTIDICNDMVREYSNVRLINLEQSSGSASRPRNIGIKNASAELITFLDPDNEISSGGYDNLLKLWDELSKSNKELTFISGYNLKITDKVNSVAKHTNEEYSVVKDIKDRYFNRGVFPTIATQAAIIKKSFLIDKNITFVEKSAGQDTLFGWEILLKSDSVVFTNKAHLIYYAQREDSITNKVDESYFDKKIILEEAQIKLLKKFDLLDIYKEYHFDNFFKNWYLKKLNLILDKKQKDAASIKLKTICDMYGKTIYLGENNE